MRNILYNESYNKQNGMDIEILQRFIWQRQIGNI